jgi:CRP/FNR family transcriptional regulator
MTFDGFYKEYFPFWEKLNDDDKKYLCDNSSVVHFEKEQPVYNNSGCSGLYIVRNGKLRLYMLSEDGIVEVTRKGINIIDKKKLRDIAM